MENINWCSFHIMLSSNKICQCNDHSSKKLTSKDIFSSIKWFQWDCTIVSNSFSFNQFCISYMKPFRLKCFWIDCYEDKRNDWKILNDKKFHDEQKFRFIVWDNSKINACRVSSKEIIDLQICNDFSVFGGFQYVFQFSDRTLVNHMISRYHLITR